jgi:ubiquinone/menaquinone biosynthesis C-methylase UbiE
MSTSEEDPPDPEAIAGFNQLARRVMEYRMAKIVLVANELDLFTIIERGHVTVEAIAQEIQGHPRPTSMLLDGLVGMQILEKNQGHYANGAMARGFLVRGSRHYKGSILRYQSHMWNFWSQLEETVRTGKPPSTLEELLARESADFRKDYIRGMAEFSARAAREVARLLAAYPVSSMLDLGCGPGLFSIELLRARAGLVADLFDLPTTLELTREFIASSGLEARTRLVTGNYHELDLDERYDLILMSHTTHDEGVEGNRKMIGSAFRHLRPGGMIAIHDFVLDENRITPLFASLFALNLLLYTREGNVYTVSDYQGWMEEAGLTELEAHPILKDEVEVPTMLLLGRRRS